MTVEPEWDDCSMCRLARRKREAADGLRCTQCLTAWDETYTSSTPAGDGRCVGCASAVYTTRAGRFGAGRNDGRGER